MAVSTEGRREIIALPTGLSEAEVFWTGFLRALVKRGLKGVKLVISDAHEGLKGASRRVLGATWQRCPVHWTRNALADAPRTRTAIVAAGIRQAFQQPDAAAKAALPHLGEQVHNRWPKLKAFIADSVEHVTAAMILVTCPHRHLVECQSRWRSVAR